jgi:RNA polymerase sigma-70 factor (ECF subfamily)
VGSDVNGFLDNSCVEKQNTLLTKAMHGDNTAFEELMSTYIKVIYNYILIHVSNSEDVKDILQETMLSIWQSIKSYNQTALLKTWIISITRRKIANFYRKFYADKAFEFIDITELGEQLSEEDDTDSIINSINIKNAVDTLSFKDKELLFLVFNAQLTYGEIESITSIPVGTIKSRMYAIKTKLRPLLEDRRDKDG